MELPYRKIVQQHFGFRLEHVIVAAEVQLGGAYPSIGYSPAVRGQLLTGRNRFPEVAIDAGFGQAVRVHERLDERALLASLL